MRRQCRRFALYRIRLPVRMRIHCGMGRFCLSLAPSVFFVRSVLLAGCEGRGREGGEHGGPRGGEAEPDGGLGRG